VGENFSFFSLFPASYWLRIQSSGLVAVILIRATTIVFVYAASVPTTYMAKASKSNQTRSSDRKSNNIDIDTRRRTRKTSAQSIPVQNQRANSSSTKASKQSKSSSSKSSSGVPSTEQNGARPFGEFLLSITSLCIS
jgi:hypothetical protein